MLVLRAASALTALVLLSGRVLAADGGSGAPDGAGGCSSSGACAPPTPYCQPTTRTCVECFSTRNCPSSMVCDTTSGECRGCLTEGDCPPETPFCSAGGACVECTNDAQCGIAGMQCIDGVCGRCGDGICGPKEGINTGIVCRSDCAKFCPSKDVGSALGRFTVDGTSLGNRLATECPASTDGVEASFAWRAPYSGTFRFTGFDEEISVSIPLRLPGDPPDFCGEVFGGGNCETIQPNDAGQRVGFTDLSVKKGDPVLVVAETGLVHADSVSIGIACAPMGCPDGGPGTGSDQGAAGCVERAKLRGEAMCTGVECACQHCPQDYDECGTIPGCSDITRCMRATSCVAEECAASGACQSVIDAVGGISAPAFETAARVESCELTFGCELPCAADGGSKDGAVTDSGVETGAPCTPGEEAPCACEGGTGRRTCLDAGTLGACVCGAPGREPAIGCDCSIAHRRAGSGALAAAMALVAGVLGAAARRYQRKNRRTPAS